MPRLTKRNPLIDDEAICDSEASALFSDEDSTSEDSWLEEIVPPAKRRKGFNKSFTYVTHCSLYCRQKIEANYTPASQDCSIRR